MHAYNVGSESSDTIFKQDHTGYRKELKEKTLSELHKLLKELEKIPAEYSFELGTNRCFRVEYILTRFQHRMKIEHLFVMPDKATKQIYVLPRVFYNNYLIRNDFWLGANYGYETKYPEFFVAEGDDIHKACIKLIENI